MSTMTKSRRRWLTPLGSWVLGVLGLWSAPLLMNVDPEAAFDSPGPNHLAWWAGLALLTIQAIALAWRSTHPSAILVATAAMTLVGGVVGLGDSVGVLSVAVVVAAFSWGLRAEYGGAWPAPLAAAVLVGVGTLLSGEPAGSGLVQGLGVVGLPLTIGLWLRGRHELAAAQQEQLRARAGELEARIQAAVAHERTAMARELHDIAAHHLSGIAVMTAAIGTQIDTDPAAAKRAVHQVRQECTGVLKDLRSLVGLLRDEGPVAEPSAASMRPESLANIGELVHDVRSAGIDVSTDVLNRGDELGAGIGPLAQLTAYRMVQESLANAARHAPGTQCTVIIDDTDPSQLTVEVTNSPGERGTELDSAVGFGLVGMRERADLTSSRLDYGPTASGGWSVRLRVPRQDAATQEAA